MKGGSESLKKCDLKTEDGMSACEMISLYVDGELDDERSRVISAHLEECEECSASYEAFKKIKDMIGSAELDMPSELHSRIMSGLGFSATENDGAAKGKKARILGLLTRRAGVIWAAGIVAVICLTMVASPIFKRSVALQSDDALEFSMKYGANEAAVADNAENGEADEYVLDGYFEADADDRMGQAPYGEYENNDKQLGMCEKPCDGDTARESVTFAKTMTEDESVELSWTLEISANDAAINYVYTNAYGVLGAYSASKAPDYETTRDALE